MYAGPSHNRCELLVSFSRMESITRNFVSNHSNHLMLHKVHKCSLPLNDQTVEQLTATLDFALCPPITAPQQLLEAPAQK